MSDCKIVDNIVLGKTFQYRRTHKRESADCTPNNVMPLDSSMQETATALLALEESMFHMLARLNLESEEELVGPTEMVGLSAWLPK